MIDLLRERFRTDPSQLPVFYEAGDFDGETWADGELPASEFVEAVARQSGYTVKDLRNWADLASGLQKLANQDARERVLRWLESQSRKNDGDFGPILSTARQDWLRTFALAIELNKLDQLHNYLNRIEVYAKPLLIRIRTAGALNALDRLLQLPGLEIAQLQQVFAQTTDRGTNSGRLPESRRDMLRALPLSMDDPLRHAAEFALRVNEKAQSPGISEWVLENVEQETLSEIEKRLRAESKDPTHYLLCWVNKGRFTALLFRGRGFDFVKKWPRIEFEKHMLGDIIDYHVSEVERLYSQNLIVQFMVSCEYFNWSPQAIMVGAQLGAQALGSTYLTMMRWRERALRLPRTRHREWVERAKQVLHSAEASNALKFGWIGSLDNAHQVRNVLEAVGREHQIVAFDFAAPQTLGQANNPLASAITEGIPLIIWPCEDTLDVSEIRSALDNNKDQTENLSLRHLADYMKKFYRNNGAKWQLTVFWDDPEQKPEKWEYVDE